PFPPTGTATRSASAPASSETDSHPARTPHRHERTCDRLTKPAVFAATAARARLHPPAERANMSRRPCRDARACGGLGGCSCPDSEERTMADPNLPRPDQASMAWNTVATYTSYEEAQQAVARLTGEQFPVGNLDIVGTGLRLVERVTGRLPKARAAAAGAASGAWFGLFIGLLVGLFTTGPTWIGLILGGLLIGAAWGAIFGFASHAATRGRRDFSSSQTLVASRYDIIPRRGTASPAQSILQQAGLLRDQPAAQPPPM